MFKLFGLTVKCEIYFGKEANNLKYFFVSQLARSDPQIQAKFIEIKHTMREFTTTILKFSPNVGE